LCAVYVDEQGTPHFKIAAESPDDLKKRVVNLLPGRATTARAASSSNPFADLRKALSFLEVTPKVANGHERQFAFRALASGLSLYGGYPAKAKAGVTVRVSLPLVGADIIPVGGQWWLFDDEDSKARVVEWLDAGGAKSATVDDAGTRLSFAVLGRDVASLNAAENRQFVAVRKLNPKWRVPLPADAAESIRQHDATLRKERASLRHESPAKGEQRAEREARERRNAIARSLHFTVNDDGAVLVGGAATITPFGKLTFDGVNERYLLTTGILSRVIKGFQTMKLDTMTLTGDTDMLHINGTKTGLTCDAYIPAIDPDDKGRMAATAFAGRPLAD
jgi:hypothetical protein